MDLAKSQDAIVIGGGPAGLSAALALGRQRRSAVVCDTNEPAKASAAVHGALGSDGVSPRELRRMGPRGVRALPDPELSRRRRSHGRAGRWRLPRHARGRAGAARTRGHPRLRPPLRAHRRFPAPGSSSDHACCTARSAMAGRPATRRWRSSAATPRHSSLRSCCDAWLILCTNGPHALHDDRVAQLQGAGVPVHEQRVAAIAEAGDGVELRFKDKGPERRDAVFLHHTPGEYQLVARLNLDRGDDGRIQVDETGQTSIPGLYAAGDLCTFAQVTLAISTGAVAGSAASAVLAYEDLAKKPGDE